MWGLVIASSVVSGVLYRMGGWGDEGRARFPHAPTWMFNTKARDMGCSVVTGCCSAFLFSSVWFIHVASFVLLFGALTTYWDWIFGYDNHWFHGWVCGIAYFPYVIWGTVSWEGWLVRCIAIAMLMGLVSKLSVNDVVEEVGRGAALPLTLPLFIVF